MDIFELAYKIVGQGQTEANDALKQTDAAGQKAAASLTEVEAAAQRASVAGQKVAAAFQQAGLQLDQAAFNKGIAQGIAEEFKTLAATATGPGLGTFNQALGETERRSLGSTRGLYLLDRALGEMAGSALGASSGFTRLGEGLLLFSTAGHTATIVLAAIAGALLPLGFAYSLVTERSRTLDDAQEKLFDDLATGALKVDALTAATEGWHTALAKLADDKTRLDRIEAIFGPHAQALPFLTALGPAGAAFALGGLVGTQQTANDQAKAEAAVSEGQRRTTEELVAAKAKELQLLAESIKLGTLDASGRQRITELIRDAVQIEQTGNLTREQRNRLEQAAQGITQAFAEIQRKATEEEKKRTQAIRDQQEALIRQASLAEQALAVMGQTPERIAALRTALGNLTAATSDDNITRLVNLGLIQQAIQLLEAQKKATQDLAAATREAIPGRAGATFGLGGVTTGAQGAPITFGQGISLAPAEQAALVPERSLTAPFGQGLAAPLIPNNFFDRSIQTLTQGFQRVNAVTQTGIRSLSAAMSGAATNLAQTFEAAMKGAFLSVADTIGALIGGLFTGRHIDFGKEVLAALGNLFVRMGEAMIAASPIFKGLAAAMSNPFTAGPALAAYGAALVALGAALGAIAQGGSGAGAPGGGGAAASNTPVHVIVVGTSLGAAGRVQNPAPFVYAPTNIGVTDPVGQAQIARMVQLGQRRNLPSGI